MIFKYFFVKSVKKLTQILSFTKFYTDLIQILMINSNHPRRLEIIEKLNKKQKIYDFDQINFSSILFNNSYKSLSIFIGDSHSEYYGRNFLNKHYNNSKYLTFWLGPKMLFSYGTDININLKILKLLKFLNLLKGNKVPIKVIFCLGEIDVRSIFYQLLFLDKSFSNEGKLIKNIGSCFFKNFSYLFDQTKDLNVKYFFLDIHPTTFLKGRSPKSINELRKVRSGDNYPVLGSINERVVWRNKLSNYFKTNCKRNIEFIKSQKSFFGKKGVLNKNLAMITAKKYFDKFHIVNVKELYKLQKKINEFK